jgi:hypothetical protein
VLGVASAETVAFPDLQLKGDAILVDQIEEQVVRHDLCAEGRDCADRVDRSAAPALHFRELA